MALADCRASTFVKRLRALGEPLFADFDALNLAMLHEIFGSRERAA